MPERRNSTLVNFINGEWSPLMAARVDDDGYNKSLAWCQNFIPLPQGGLKYRPGNYLAGLTQLVATGYLIPFQFSSTDAVVIEATDSTFAFYWNGAKILNANQTITGITQANPAVVTSAAHGYSNGQQVFISGVFGMPQINDRYYIVQGVTTNTFQLTDQFGVNVNSAAYGAYTSGGNVASVFTVATPYAVTDIPNVRYAQVGDIMYLVHPNYPPYKLTRTDFTSWTMATFARTNDPFASGSTFTITNVTRAKPAVVTVSSITGLANGDSIEITNVHGMNELNGETFIVEGITGSTFQLFDTNGNPIDSRAFRPYTTGGTVTQANNFPSCVAFTSDGRLAYAGSRFNPQGLWGSMLPGTTSGTYTPGTQTNYDNFSTGTLANDAYAFQFAPVNGLIDGIQELKSFGGMLALLGASSVQQAFGASSGSPPNPSAIGETQPTVQGSAHVAPLSINQNLLFIDVNEKKLRGLQFNFYFSAFEAIDYNLKSSHFGDESPFVKIVHMKGIPEIVWCLRADGVLLSFTFSNFDPKDPLAYTGAWARHYVGGGGSVIDICTIRNSSGDDQLWMTVQRTIGANVFNTVEVLSNWPDIPLKRSFFTGNKDADRTNWAAAAWEQLKLASFLDMSLTYDGRERGNQTLATITPSAITGNGITLTASAAVFQPADVNTELWKFYNADGSGGGQARITGYTSATQVTADVINAFDNVTAINPGSWAFAVQQVVNLQLLAGQEVDVQADGGAHPSITVANNGSASLEWFASIIQFGFSFTGLAATQNLDFGTQMGPGGRKPRNVKRIRAILDNSIGGQVGTSEYDCETMVTREVEQNVGAPPEPFTGAVDVPLLDFWSADVKEAVVLHQEPTPLTLLGFDVELYTNEPP